MLTLCHGGGGEWWMAYLTATNVPTYVTDKFYEWNSTKTSQTVTLNWYSAAVSATQTAEEKLPSDRSELCELVLRVVRGSEFKVTTLIQLF